MSEETNKPKSISDCKINFDDVAKQHGIQTLSDRPNRAASYGSAGLSSQELKKRFDALSEILSKRLNALCERLTSDSVTADFPLPSGISSMVENSGVTDLQSLINSIITGTFSNILKVDIYETSDSLPSLTAKLKEILEAISALEEAVLNRLMLTKDEEDGEKNQVIETPVHVKGNFKAGNENPFTYDDENGGEFQGPIVGTSAKFTKKFIAGHRSPFQYTDDGGAFAAPIQFNNRISVGNENPFTYDDENGGDFQGPIVGKGATFDNLTVNNLEVKGKTTIVEQETVVTPENIIVTNSEGATFSTSGLVIRTGKAADGVSEAYGILYAHDTDAVMIGIGTLTKTVDETSGAVGYEFEYKSGEALPLAARDGEFPEGVVPVWDASKKAFKSSGGLYASEDSTISPKGFLSEGGRLTTRDDVFSVIKEFATSEQYDWVSYNGTYPDKPYKMLLANLKYNNSTGQTYEANNIFFKLKTTAVTDIDDISYDIYSYQAENVDFVVKNSNSAMVGIMTGTVTLTCYLNQNDGSLHTRNGGLQVSGVLRAIGGKTAQSVGFSYINLKSTYLSITKVKTENLKSLVTTLTEIQSGGVI